MTLDFKKLDYKKQRNIVFWLLLCATGFSIFLLWRVAGIAANQNIAELSNDINLRNEQQVDSIIKSYESVWNVKLAEKDKELARYQEMLSKKGSSTVAVVQTKIIYRDTGSITDVVVLTKDSIVLDSVFPVYEGQLINKWVDLKITAGKDSIKYDLQTSDSLVVIFRQEKQGFLKPKKTVAYFYSQSPYSGDQSQLIQYVLVPKRKGWLARLIGKIFNNGKE